MKTDVKKSCCRLIAAGLYAGLLCMLGSGCLEGYSNSSLYPEDIRSVYVEMFDTANFRRGYEYQLTDAICKQIEAKIPNCKIISDRDQADSILSGSMRMLRSVRIPPDISTNCLPRITITAIPERSAPARIVTQAGSPIIAGQAAEESGRRSIAPIT